MKLTRTVKAIYCVCILTACSNVKPYSTGNAHSHNDYLNPQPLECALSNQFGSVEADVFPVNGVLLVAHDKKDTLSSRSLYSLYTRPLFRLLTSSNKQKLNLLIDIKENHKLAIQLLLKELEPLMPYLSTPEKPNYLTVIISGERPVPAEYDNYPPYIFFDDNLKFSHNNEQWRRVLLVSLPFNKYSKWTGKGPLKGRERKRLQTIVDSVHRAGKPIRFWAAPDTKFSWEKQKQLGVDFIGTDKIRELGDFMKRNK